MNGIASNAESLTPIFSPGAADRTPCTTSEKLVRQIAVTMFDVHKVESQLPGQFSGAVEVFDDRADLGIGEQWMFGRQMLPPV